MLILCHWVVDIKILLLVSSNAIHESNPAVSKANKKYLELLILIESEGELLVFDPYVVEKQHPAYPNVCSDLRRCYHGQSTRTNFALDASTSISRKKPFSPTALTPLKSCYKVHVRRLLLWMMVLGIPLHVRVCWS